MAAETYGDLNRAKAERTISLGVGLRCTDNIGNVNKTKMALNKMQTLGTLESDGPGIEAPCVTRARRQDTVRGTSPARSPLHV